MPTLRRSRLTSTPSPVTTSPSTQMSPPSIGSSALMHRSSVDLPEPDAPIRQTTSCRATSRETPLSTSLSP